jgi:hypothetical protein
VHSPLDFGVIDGGLCCVFRVIGGRTCPLRYAVCVCVSRGQCVVCSPLNFGELTMGFVIECVRLVGVGIMCVMASVLMCGEGQVAAFVCWRSCFGCGRP